MKGLKETLAGPTIFWNVWISISRHMTALFSLILKPWIFSLRKVVPTFNHHMQCLSSKSKFISVNVSLLTLLIGTSNHHTGLVLLIFEK